MNHSKFSYAYFNRGETYSKLGMIKVAIQNFDQAIELNPTLAIAYLNRGYCNARQGKYGLAYDDFNSAINLDPRLKQFLQNDETSGRVYAIPEIVLKLRDSR